MLWGVGGGPYYYVSSLGGSVTPGHLHTKLHQQVAYPS